MRRTKEDAAVTRRQVAEAALELFSQQGYAATTLKEVAARAGVTRGAIYWHFRDKADLFNSIVSEVGTRRDEVIQAAISEGGGFTAVFRRILLRLLQDVEQNREVRAIMELSVLKSSAHPEIEAGEQLRRAATQALIGNMAAYLAQGIAAGEVRSDLDAHDAALAAVAFHQGLATLWLSDPTAFSLAERAAAFTDIYLRGIVSE